MNRRLNEIRRESCRGQDRVLSQKPVGALDNKLQATSRESGFRERNNRCTPTISTTTAVRATIVAMKPRQHNLVEPRGVGK